MAWQLKDVDSVDQALRLGSFTRVFPLLSILGFLLGGWTGVAFAGIVSAALSFCSVWLSGRFSTLGINLLYGIRSANWTLQEQLAGDINRVRVHKMNRQYDQAMIAVESVLDACPDFPEAWLLKAQILWEGYQDHSGARNCLIQVSKNTLHKKDPLNRWASALYRQIASENRQKAS